MPRIDTRSRWNSQSKCNNCEKDNKTILETLKRVEDKIDKKKELNVSFVKNEKDDEEEINVNTENM